MDLMNLKEEYILHAPKEARGQFKMMCESKQQRIETMKRGNGALRVQHLTGVGVGGG